MAGKSESDANEKYAVYTYCAQEQEQEQEQESIPVNVKEIIIDPSTTIINDGAFSDCRLLTNIIMHDNIVAIGDNAFLACANLRRINLPRSLQRIGLNAFKDCTNLEFVTFPQSASATVSISIDEKETDQELRQRKRQQLERTITIDTHAFANCVSLSAVFLSSHHVISLGVGTFRNCTSLRFLHLGEDNTKINYFGYNLLLRCDDLFSDTAVKYVYDHHAAINDEEVIEWLSTRRYMNSKYSLHRLSYRTDITAQLIQECGAEFKYENASIQDDRRMLPLHIICANPHATIDVITACYNISPKKAAVTPDRFGCIPMHYLCKFHPFVLKAEGFDWIGDEQLIGCFHTMDENGQSPLHILADNGNLGSLPFTVALRHNIKWQDGMDVITVEAMTTDSNFLTTKDAKTGVYAFMLASHHNGDLSTSFELLRANPIPCDNQFM